MERQTISCCCPKTFSSFPPAAARRLPPTQFPRRCPPPSTLRCTTSEDTMENQPLLDEPLDPQRRKNSESHLPARVQYIEAPSPTIIEEPGSGLLLEYFGIVRRH